MTVLATIFGRFWPHLLAATAIISAILYLEHRGYERARADQAALEARIGARIALAVEDIDKRTAERIAGIDTTQRTVVQPVITREIMSAPRLSDPAAGITDELRGALNRARAASAPAGAGGEPVPAAPAAGR